MGGETFIHDLRTLILILQYIMYVIVDVRYYIFLIHLQTFLIYISLFCLNDFNNVNSTSNKFNIFNFCGKKQKTLWCFRGCVVTQSFQEFGRESTRVLIRGGNFYPRSDNTIENYPLSLFTIFSNKNQFFNCNFHL